MSEQQATVPAGRRAAWLAGLLALALGLLALPGDFLFDDIDIIQQDRRLDSLSNIPALFGDSYWGAAFPRRLYRPLVQTSFAIDAAFQGRSEPVVFHVTNALLYGVTAALVVLLALRLGVRRGVALAAGLLFAAHPIHTEAVANLVGRAELMAGIFMMLCLILAMPPPGRIMDWRRSTLVACCFMAGMLSKESAIGILPLVAFVPILGATAGAPWWNAALGAARERWRMWALLLAATLLWMWMRSRAIPPVGATIPVGDLDNYLYHAPASSRIAGALAITLRYLGMSVWPWPMSADYSLAALVPPTVWSSPVVLLGGLVWISGIVVALFTRRRSSPVSLGLAIWMVCLIPVANLLIPIGTIFGERLLFMPSIGVCLILAVAGGALVRQRPRWRPAMLGMLGAAIVLGAIGFGIRAREWQSEVRLFESDIRKHPGSAKIQAKLGGAYWKESLQHEGAEYQAGLQRAADHLERAVEIYPRFVQAKINLALVLMLLGDEARATVLAEEFLALAPEHLPAARAYSHIANQTNRPADALVVCRHMLQQYPADLELLEVRLDALYRLGRIEDTVMGFGPALAAGGNFERASAFADHLLSRGESALAGRLIDFLLRAPVTSGQAMAQRQLMPSLILRRSVVEIEAGRPAVALEGIDQLLAVDPGFHQARAVRVEALIALRRLKEAERDLQTLEGAVGKERVADLRGKLEESR